MAIFKITKQYRDVIKCADFTDINSRDYNIVAPPTTTDSVTTQQGILL